jgi:ComF family protein
MGSGVPHTSGRELKPLRRWLTAGSAGLVRAILPPNCLACGVPISSEGGLCSACWGRLTLIERPFCERLAIPFTFDLGEGALSAEAIADPPPFDRLRAAALYDNVARQLVHGLKYRDHLELVRWMGLWMSRAGSDVISDADVIVPVPLHWRRLWLRRFNQSAALAFAVAERSGKAVVPDALKRTRATGQQVGLGRKAREANVRGSFRVTPERRIAVAGRRVLLVDDVYTTGATMKAATRALRRAGAAAVDALVFARVARGSD